MSPREDFDQLARSVAAGVGQAVSRRSVLRGIAAGTFGSLTLGRSAWAAGAGHTGCADFCSDLFGEDTPGATACIQQAKRGAGLCYTCGPASPGGTKTICCPENSSGQCADYASATCCGTGTVCQSGACVPICGGAYAPCSVNSDCCDSLLCEFSASSNATFCVSPT